MLTFRKRFWQNRIQNLQYCKKIKFALIETLFGLVSLFSNPYRTCRKFFQSKALENIYAYGETPYLTYKRIADICEIGPSDIWFELGSGRGKGCFYLAYFRKCRVVGVEWIPSFVHVANIIKKLCRVENVSFECKDLRNIDLRGASIIYLYGHWQCSNVEIPNGIKVVTISEPLEGFRVVKKFWVRYPWGRTTAFLQVK